MFHSWRKLSHNKDIWQDHRVPIYSWRWHYPLEECWFIFILPSGQWTTAPRGAETPALGGISRHNQNSSRMSLPLNLHSCSQYRPTYDSLQVDRAFLMAPHMSQHKDIGSRTWIQLVWLHWTISRRLSTSQWGEHYGLKQVYWSPSWQMEQVVLLCLRAPKTFSWHVKQVWYKFLWWPGHVEWYKLHKIELSLETRPRWVVKQ